MVTGSVGYAWVGCGGYLSVEGELYFEQTQDMQMMFHWPAKDDAGKYGGACNKGLVNMGCESLVLRFVVAGGNTDMLLLLI